MRIIPVSSGKGGVGKTTLALNLALSLAEKYPTVLIDLDSGTSSVRNFINMEVSKDLYHFLKKEQPIQNCLRKLNRSIDPENAYTNFSFLASPKDYVHDIINFSSGVKRRLMEGINSLQAEFVILDLRAGIDQNITDFIPYDNSGLLVFTPKIKAASFTAGEIVKASIMKLFRTILENGTYCREQLSLMPEDLDVVEVAMEYIEDSYDLKEASIYKMLSRVRNNRKKNQFIRHLIRYVRDYKIYYVLNHFNSLEESVKEVIGPFVKQIASRISKSLMIRNLGWIVYEDEIMRSSQNLIPYLLFMYYRKKREKPGGDDLSRRLKDLLGEPAPRPTEEEDSPPEDLFENQLTMLKNMYVDEKGKDAVSNFIFIRNALLSIGDSSIHNLGMSRLRDDRALLDAFFRKYVGGN